MTGFWPSFNPVRCGSSIFRLCHKLVAVEDIGESVVEVFNEDDAIDEVDGEDEEVVGGVTEEEVGVVNVLGVNVSGLIDVNFDLLT